VPRSDIEQMTCWLRLVAEVITSTTGNLTARFLDRLASWERHKTLSVQVVISAGGRNLSSAYGNNRESINKACLELELNPFTPAEPQV